MSYNYLYKSGRDRILNSKILIYEDINLWRWTHLTCLSCRGCLSSCRVGSNRDSWWYRADYRGDIVAAICRQISTWPLLQWRICVANGFRRRMVPMHLDRASRYARCRNPTPRGTCTPKSRTARPPIGRRVNRDYIVFFPKIKNTNRIHGWFHSSIYN